MDQPLCKGKPALHRRQFVGGLLGLSVLFQVVSSAAAQTASPQAVIEALHAKLLEAMTGEVAADFQGRYDLLAPVLQATFDYGSMAEVAVGRFWKDFSVEEQARYSALFTEVAIAAAASRFGPAKNVVFSIIGEREGPQGTRLVETTLKPGNKEQRTIGYLMKPSEDGTSWRAIDLFYEGTISELATKRSEYVSVLKSGGLVELERLLGEKLAQYQTGGAAD